MPAKIKVKILEGRDLPVMDRASDLTDAFVEIRFGNATHKTEVFRKSLNPQWNSEWFKFEVDDEDLQDEPLQIRVLDYDTYSAHDAIGKVYIDLNPLLWRDGPSSINGWFPIYDTMHGIRGDIRVIVKVDLFTDVNKYRQSSCGVHFFATSRVPEGYQVSAICGFVEELIANDDPEYKWIDKIRTPRSSNETRQRLFSKLSGELQRKIGLKVLEMGGDTVIGYRQCFDLEGEYGIVVRSIGTAVIIQRIGSDITLSPHVSSPVRDLPPQEPATPSSSPLGGAQTGSSGSPDNKQSSSPTKANVPPLARRCSDSDINTPPKGASITSSESGSTGAKPPINKAVIQPIEMMEFPFFTLTSFPVNFLVHLCGVVSSRSVKLLDKIHNPEEPETRDAWWSEIRTEIRSNSRAMGCNAVVGYSEQTSICEDVIILSAMGTGAVVNLMMDENNRQPLAELCTMSLDRQTFEREREKKLLIDTQLANEYRDQDIAGDVTPSPCCVCHVPYNEATAPFPVTLTKCAVCKKHKVPDVLFTTVEPPAGVSIVGRGGLLQARICRSKKELKGENNAKEISDNLPFIEYDLHKQLINKLKVRGMNTLFGLQVQIVVGEAMLVAIACATAAYVEALPPPPVPKLVGKFGADKSNKKQVLQKEILDTIDKNKEIYNLTSDSNSLSGMNGTTNTFSNGYEASDEYITSDLDLSTGNRDTFVLEIDDDNEEAISSVLMDNYPPEGIFVCNTEMFPGLSTMACNKQMFTHVWQGELKSNNCKELSKICENLTRSLFFKMRNLTPCALTKLYFDIEIPDDDIVQISCNGVCIGLTNPCIGPTDQNGSTNTDIYSEYKYHHPPVSSKHIDVSPLAYIPGGHIDRYLGNVNFFYIRESTSIREVGGLSGFMHSFVAEVLALVRANVSSLGGNALVAYRMSKCVLLDNPHKNQGQCLINVCGDMVQVSYSNAD